MPKPVRPKEIKIRLSLNEHQRLLDRAGNRRLAPWLRDLGLGERPLDLRQPRAPATDPALLRHIAIIGNNLNQIARVMNTVEMSPARKIEYLSMLDRIRAAVESLATKKERAS